jgi:hypothetical protein
MANQVTKTSRTDIDVDDTHHSDQGDNYIYVVFLILFILIMWIGVSSGWFSH